MDGYTIFIPLPYEEDISTGKQRIEDTIIGPAEFVSIKMPGNGPPLLKVFQQKQCRRSGKTVGRNNQG